MMCECLLPGVNVFELQQLHERLSLTVQNLLSLSKIVASAHQELFFERCRGFYR